MKRNLFLFFILFSLFYSQKIYSREISIKTYTLTVHLSHMAIINGDEYPGKLDLHGWIIYMPGGELGYYYDADKNIFGIDKYKIVAGYYLDSRFQSSGYLLFSPRWHFKLSKNFTLDIGAGPFIYFRKSWTKFKNYDGNPLLLENFGYEYIFFIFGDINLEYAISKNLKIVWGIVPAIPYSWANNIGLIYRF